MNLVPLVSVAPLSGDRIKPFNGERPYLATGALDDDGNQAHLMVTYANRPARADMRAVEGDVCMARMQGTRKILRVEARHADLILSSGFAVFRPRPGELDSAYLAHYLSTDVFQLAKDALCTGATQKAITNEKLAVLTIPLPALGAQRHIAAMLDSASALRGKRRRSLLQLEALARSLFLDLFDRPYAASNGGEEVRLKDVTKRITYGFTSPMKHLDEGIPIITAKNIRDGYIDFENVHFADEAEFRALTAKCKPKRGDLLITKDGTIGRCAVVETDEPLCINQSVALVQPDDHSVLPSFLMSYLSSERVQHAIKQMSKGNAMAHLKITELAELPISVPSIADQKLFEARLGAVGNLRAAARASLAAIEALRSSLVGRAFQPSP